MTITYPITKQEIITANPLPLAELLDQHFTYWQDQPGILQLRREILPTEHYRPEPPPLVKAYWQAALKTMPWLPYLAAPNQPAFLELFLSQLPRLKTHVHPDGRVDYCFDRSVGNDLCSEWNTITTAMAVSHGVNPARLSHHLGGIATTIAQIGLAPAETNSPPPNHNETQTS